MLREKLFAEIITTYQYLVSLKKVMIMAKNTSVLLGDHFEDFINEEVASGRFNSASEVVRTALRLLEVQEQKLKHLRKEIEIGEQSGFVSNFDPEVHLANLQKKHQ